MKTPIVRNFLPLKTRFLVTQDVINTYVAENVSDFEFAKKMSEKYKETVTENHIWNIRKDFDIPSWQSAQRKAESKISLKMRIAVLEAAATTYSLQIEDLVKDLAKLSLQFDEYRRTRK